MSEVELSAQYGAVVADLKDRVRAARLVAQLTAPKRWKMLGWVGAAVLILAGFVMVSGSFGVFWSIIGVFYLVLGAGILGMEIYEVTTRRGRSKEIDGVSDE